MLVSLATPSQPQNVSPPSEPWFSSVCRVYACVCAVCMRVFLPQCNCLHLSLQPTLPTHDAVSESIARFRALVTLPHGDAAH